MKIWERKGKNRLGIAEVGDALYALDFGSGEAGGFDAGFRGYKKSGKRESHIWDKPIACEEISEEDRAELTGFPSEEEAEKKAGDLEAAGKRRLPTYRAAVLRNFRRMPASWWYLRS